MKRRLSLSLLLTLLVLANGCTAQEWPERRGQVLEAGTNKPIPGAIVIVRWKGTASIWPADAQTQCYHVESATSNERGEYVIPAWRETADQRLLGDKQVFTDAFKPGYARSPEYFKQESYRKNIELLESFKGTRGERLAELRRFNEATSCPDAGESKKNRLVLQKAVYEEARSLAITPADREIVNKLLFGLESEQFGSMEALKRMDARKRGANDNY